MKPEPFAQRHLENFQSRNDQTGLADVQDNSRAKPSSIAYHWKSINLVASLYRQVCQMLLGGALFGLPCQRDDLRMLGLVLLPYASRGADSRKPRFFHPEWMYCQVSNATDEALFVYGPRHPLDATAWPTSLFLLPPRRTTPRLWDCKAVLVPFGRMAIVDGTVVRGPSALKYRDMRRIRIEVVPRGYRCPRSDGISSPDQLDFHVPLASYQSLLGLPHSAVPV
jgi:hypothetical protein